MINSTDHNFGETTVHDMGDCEKDDEIGFTQQRHAKKKQHREIQEEYKQTDQYDDEYYAERDRQDIERELEIREIGELEYEKRHEHDFDNDYDDAADYTAGGKHHQSSQGERRQMTEDEKLINSASVINNLLASQGVQVGIDKSYVAEFGKKAFKGKWVKDVDPLVYYKNGPVLIPAGMCGGLWSAKARGKKTNHSGLVKKPWITDSRALPWLRSILEVVRAGKRLSIDTWIKVVLLRAGTGGMHMTAIRAIGELYFTGKNIENYVLTYDRAFCPKHEFLNTLEDIEQVINAKSIKDVPEKNMFRKNLLGRQATAKLQDRVIYDVTMYEFELEFHRENAKELASNWRNHILKNTFKTSENSDFSFYGFTPEGTGLYTGDSISLQHLFEVLKPYLDENTPRVETCDVYALFNSLDSEYCRAIHTGKDVRHVSSIKGLLFSGRTPIPFHKYVNRENLEYALNSIDGRGILINGRPGLTWIHNSDTSSAFQQISPPTVAKLIGPGLVQVLTEDELQELKDAGIETKIDGNKIFFGVCTKEKKYIKLTKDDCDILFDDIKSFTEKDIKTTKAFHGNQYAFQKDIIPELEHHAELIYKDIKKSNDVPIPFKDCVKIIMNYLLNHCEPTSLEIEIRRWVDKEGYIVDSLTYYDELEINGTLHTCLDGTTIITEFNRKYDINYGFQSDRVEEENLYAMYRINKWTVEYHVIKS